jgi:predicted Zn-dependent protease with MMP-like domain
MYEVDRETFEGLVTSAVEDLPDTFRDRVTNLQFVVEDLASSDDYARVSGGLGGTLLGVYRGIPLPRRSRHYNMALPDRIVIFQQPIQRLARSEADLSERVRHVVRHEIAHYFGISDERLREIDAY